MQYLECSELAVSGDKYSQHRHHQCHITSTVVVVVEIPCSPISFPDLLHPEDNKRTIHTRLDELITPKLFIEFILTNTGQDDSRPQSDLTGSKLHLTPPFLPPFTAPSTRIITASSL